MGIRDIEAFVRQAAAKFDANLDASPGSPFDVRLIQPLVRRLGQDPFTVDLTTFLYDRVTQAFPELATKSGDAVTDLLIKPASVLWDPIVREVRKVKRSLSFQDPETLTLDEADALGANLFETRRKGDLARGIARIFFASPQSVTITPANYFSARGGKHYFPIDVQQIRMEEMLNNITVEGLYYFDVNVIAERAGADYNIGPNELVSVANVGAAVRVQNLRRFRDGKTEENVATFVGRVRQSLSERSLVSLRGIASKILNNFPEVNRLNVVGFNDPEMQRDVLTGGGLGEIVAGGVSGITIADGEGKAKTRRFFTTEANFITLISGEPTSWVITLFGATGSVVLVRDFDVRSVVSANELALQDQEMTLGVTGIRWTLRKRELTLSGIPGGILFPDTANGTVSVPDGTLHIGGATDVHVRGTDFEESTLAIDNVTDDVPLFSGSELAIDSSGNIELSEFVLGTDYDELDATWREFSNAALFTYTLQVLDGVDAGNYRIIGVTQSAGNPVELVVSPTPTNPSSGPFRWRLFDKINIDLVNPRETRISGSDLRTVQGLNTVDTVGGLDFNTYGVAEGDVLRVLDGPNSGDYTITAAPIAPSYDKLQVDQKMTHSGSNFEYTIFRANAAGGVTLPLIRVKAIEVLDSSGQPIGSSVPYAKPVDIQTRAFQNPARGIKHDLRDVILGLVSNEQSTWTSVDGLTLIFRIAGSNYTVAFPGSTGTSLTNIITQVSTQLNSLLGLPEMAIQVGSSRFGIRPVLGGVTLVGGTALSVLFGLNSDGVATAISTFDIRSAAVTADGGFDEVEPLIDLTRRLDVVQVLDGVNTGVYEGPYVVGRNLIATFPAVPGDSDALTVGAQDRLPSGFAPEAGRRVQVGSRSLGSVRMYFLEPTSIEVDPRTVYTLETETGNLDFIPDPTLSHQRIPALPGGDPTDDGVSVEASNTFSAASQDFVQSAIQPGDQLVIENIPIAGSIALADPVQSLVNRTLVFSVGGGPDRTLTFIRNDSSLAVHEVGRQSVVDQINAAAGANICSLTGSNTLEFETDLALVIRRTGTANGPDGTASPAFLGLLGDVAGTGGALSFVDDDQTNASPHAGTYTVETVGSGGVANLTTEENFPPASPYASPLSRQSYKVMRQGIQRITTTDMAANEAEAGLYYFDVELVSVGTGDVFNIDSDQQMTAVGYRADGYYLETGDANLTFSTLEPLKLVLSRSILEQGVDDDPVNATQLSGQNLQVTYEYAPLVEDIQNYIGSDIERVVCSSPLGRHLIPVFVRLDLEYAGGSKESVVTPEVEQLITDLFPADALEASDVQKIPIDRGATYVKNPIDLIGIVHRTDRTVYAVRSQNSITAGRLNAFIPDVINVTRNTT